MEFPRIGARELKLTHVEQHELPAASHCYCPHCGQGPMDGVTGIQLQIEGTPDQPRADIDFTVRAGTKSLCVFCGTMVIFQEDADGKLSLREMNREDIREMKRDLDNWAAFMKTKEMVDLYITISQINGKKRYAGNITKSIL